MLPPHARRCAALLNKALGPERIINLHIDHGFMRHEESARVQAALHPTVARRGCSYIVSRPATVLISACNRTSLSL